MADSHPSGTIVTLCNLEARTDLNGETAMLTSKVLDSGRHEAFVLWNDDRTRRPEGINVLPAKFTVNTTDRRGRASAWNELGSRFVHTGNHANALDAFECALEVASKESDECRVEGCDALALMAWLGLRMNSEGIEFEGERTAAEIVRFGLRNIFMEVLENAVAESSTVNMGAGRIPSRPHPVLLLSVTDADGASRYFFYDEEQKVVHECVEKIMDDSISKDDAGHAAPPDGALDVPETPPRGQEVGSGEE